jgi:hypothetical protein
MLKGHLCLLLITLTALSAVGENEEISVFLTLANEIPLLGSIETEEGIIEGEEFYRKFFIGDPQSPGLCQRHKPKDNTEDPQLKKLSKYCKKIVNFFKVQRRLKDCAIDSELRSRILQIASRVDLKDVNCDDFSLYSEIESKLSPASEIARAQTLSDFQDLLHKQNIKNATFNYWRITKQFPTEEAIHQTLCSNCSKPERDEIRRHVLEFEKNYSISPLTAREVAEAINTFSMKTDSLLDQVEVKDNSSFEGLNPLEWNLFQMPFATKEGREAYKKYALAYGQMATSEIGPIFTSQEVVNRLEKFKSIDRQLFGYGDFTGRPGHWRLTHHKGIDLNESEAVIERAVEEVKTTIKSHVTKLTRIASKKTISDAQVSSGVRPKSQTINDLKKIVANNPIPVGQVLINQPEQTFNTCLILNEIDRDKTLNKTFDRALFAGGIIAGAAGVVAGFATAGGTWPMAVAVTGATLSGIGTGNEILRTIKEGRRVVNLREALISGNSDGEVLPEIDRATREQRSAKQRAILSAMFLALDLGAVASTAGRLKPNRLPESPDLRSTSRAPKRRSPVKIKGTRKKNPVRWTFSEAEFEAARYRLPPNIRRRFDETFGVGPNFKPTREAQNELGDLLDFERALREPITPDGDWARIIATHEDVAKFNRSFRYFGRRGRKFHQTSFQGRDLKMDDYALKKMQAWIKSKSYDINVEVQGHFRVQEVGGETIITDFFPQSGYVTSVKNSDNFYLRNGTADQFNAHPYTREKQLMGPDHYDDLYGKYYRPKGPSPKYGPPDFVHFHSHYKSSSYQGAPSPQDFEHTGIKVLYTPYKEVVDSVPQWPPQLVFYSGSKTSPKKVLAIDITQ